MQAPSSWPADKIERRPVVALIPNARNARTHTQSQIEQIAASIKEWGWTVPVLIDEAETVIAGHGRLLAAELLGIVDVPVIVARGWSDAQKRAYVIADNKLTENGGWDLPTLRLEIGELTALGFDVPLIGFSESELDKLASFGQAPEQFAEYGEDIATEHQCPKCGYVWSGSTTVVKEGGRDEPDPGRVDV